MEKRLNINKTGYLKGYATNKNDHNIIKGKNGKTHITTRNMAFPISANGKELYPDTGDYIFNDDEVLETPLQKGGNLPKNKPEIGTEDYNQLKKYVSESRGIHPDAIDKVFKYIGNHESKYIKPGDKTFTYGDPKAKQVGGGPGRGVYQFEPDSLKTAINRAKNIGKRSGINPDWVQSSTSTDATQYTKAQQDYFALATALEQPGFNIKNAAIEASKPASESKLPLIHGSSWQTSNDPKKIELFRKDMQIAQAKEQKKLFDEYKKQNINPVMFGEKEFKGLGLQTGGWWKNDDSHKDYYISDADGNTIGRKSKITNLKSGEQVREYKRPKTTSGSQYDMRNQMYSQYLENNKEDDNTPLSTVIDTSPQIRNYIKPTSINTGSKKLNNNYKQYLRKSRNLQEGGSIGGAAAKGALTGASTGAVLGPWGMAGGAIVGGAIGGIKAYADKQQNEIDVNKLKIENDVRLAEMKQISDASALSQYPSTGIKNKISFYGRSGGNLQGSGLGKATGGKLQKLSSDAYAVKGNEPSKIDAVKFKQDGVALDHNEVVKDGFVHSYDFGYADKVMKLEQEKGKLEKNKSLRNRMRIREIDRTVQSYGEKQEAEKETQDNGNYRCGGNLQKSLRH